MKRKNRWRLQGVKRYLNVLVSVRSHKRLQGRSGFIKCLRIYFHEKKIQSSEHAACVFARVGRY